MSKRPVGPAMTNTSGSATHASRISKNDSVGKNARHYPVTMPPPPLRKPIGLRMRFDGVMAVGHRRTHPSNTVLATAGSTYCGARPDLAGLLFGG
jgi:hypothetical protein